MANEVNNPEMVNAEAHWYVGDISLGTKRRSPGDAFVIYDLGAMLNPTDDSGFSYWLAF